MYFCFTLECRNCVELFSSHIGKNLLRINTAAFNSKQKNSHCRSRSPSTHDFVILCCCFAENGDCTKIQNARAEPWWFNSLTFNPRKAIRCIESTLLLKLDSPGDVIKPVTFELVFLWRQRIVKSDTRSFFPFNIMSKNLEDSIYLEKKKIYVIVKLK